MANIGTTFTKSGKKAVLCGSGELGKEVALELQRYGVEVVALDKYANAPAMHIAHRNHVLSMLDGDALETVIREEKPDFIIPEIEAIATDRLVKLEEEGFNVVPTAQATKLTMNREGIRRLAAETLGIPTSPYRFAETREEFDKAGLAGKVWQYFIAIPDVKSVGVRNEMRYEGWPAIIRAINTTDAMTATIEEIPYALLHHITDRITHEVEGINRVLYDLTPKPIGTIEWE